MRKNINTDRQRAALEVLFQNYQAEKARKAKAGNEAAILGAMAAKIKAQEGRA